jgi:hypothetical protein
MSIITKGSSWYDCQSTEVVLKISYHTHMVLMRDSEEKCDLKQHKYRAHIVSANKKNQAPAGIHSQTLPAKNTLKYY